MNGNEPKPPSCLLDREIAVIIDERRRVEQRLALLREGADARAFGGLRADAEDDVARGVV